MNYATQNNIGDGNRSRTEKATAIARAVGRVCTMDAKTKGRRRSAERQAEIRTRSNATNGILKCTFLPKLKTAQSVQTCEKTERDFYKSLSLIANHYHIIPMQSQQFDFPYNIALAMWDLKNKLKQTVENWEDIRLITDDKKTYIESTERYDTDTTLYYIPIFPLFKMLQNKKRRHTAKLLLSVCSYLYHIVNIPYYRQEESYLYWVYEMHKEWIESEEETHEIKDYKREFIKSENIGDRIEQKLYNLANLKVFEKRINSFRAQDSLDKAYFKVASNAYALFKEYPTTSIFRNAQIYEQNPYDYCDEVIGMEKYIAFVAETKGWLYENLVESINNEFNECDKIEEPSIKKHFDGRKITTMNLDFEKRLFTVLNDLTGLLYEYKTEKR